MMLPPPMFKLNFLDNRTYKFIVNHDLLYHDLVLTTIQIITIHLPDFIDEPKFMNKVIV